MDQPSPAPPLMADGDRQEHMSYLMLRGGKIHSALCISLEILIYCYVYDFM